jgi:hypothetical protein
MMRPLSPSLDRIGAALKALRQTQDHDAKGDDKVTLGAKCLHVVIAQLREEGLPQEDLQPLVDLETILQKLKTQAQADGLRNRRKGRPPSEALLARASAVIDLLIKAGRDESEAAQMVMRRLMAVGVPPPEKGGDARGWRRLLEYRNEINQGLGSKEAQLEYRDFTREIESIPAPERVRRVLDEQLWDRRRKAS